MRHALVAVAIAATGCTNVPAFREAADSTTRTVTAAAPLLHAYCTDPGERALAEVRAMPPGEARQRAADAAADDLRDRGCLRAANAYDGAAKAAVVFSAVVAAAEAGNCAGVSVAARECNLAGAMTDAVVAGSDLATAIQRVRKP